MDFALRAGEGGAAHRRGRQRHLRRSDANFAALACGYSILEPCFSVAIILILPCMRQMSVQDSFRRAIVSLNICKAACTFSSPFGDCRIVIGLPLRWA